MSAQKITNEGFLDEFKQRHDQMADRPFCWILGSGASVQSGIPSGKALAIQWLAELHRREDFNNVPIETWATAENLGIPGFDYTRAANFYPWIYQRRFRDYKEQGYAFLEKTMDHAEPSFGYSVLAQIMATTSHKVAVTTNFDNLIADALSIYTRIFPLVCGHESLTGYIRPNLRRPLVAKIHRDLLLAPLSNPDETAELPGEWAAALAKIFDRFTPVVIGYGGNDGSLMGLFKNLSPIEGGIFWCYRDGSELELKIHEVVEHHHGRLVPIAGFDEVMLQLQEKLQLAFLLPELESAHQKRVTSYKKHFGVLTAALRKPAKTQAAEEARKPVRKAAEAAVERLTKEKDWWAWQLKAEAEPDPVKREAIFRLGIEDFPKSEQLCSNFANFLTEVRKNHDDAERFYREALLLDSNHAVILGNFATFKSKVRKEHDEAERLYRRSLELDPNDSNNLGAFAFFMHRVRDDYDFAELLYLKALELDPNDPENITNFALFLVDVRKNYDEAGRLYHKALDLDPNNVNIIGALAIFVKDVRKDYEEAERLYRKALELDPNHGINIGNFAIFMEFVRHDYDEAERLYRGALEIDPNNAINMGNYAQFLSSMDRLAEASELTSRSWELIDKKPSTNCSEIAFTRWLLGRAERRDESQALGRLKTILTMEFPRAVWSFDRLLSVLLPQLPEDERTLAHRLADAILDESKVGALENEPLWKAVEPIPLEVPWPD